MWMTDEKFEEINDMNGILGTFGAGIGFLMHPMPANQEEYDELLEVVKKAIELQDENYIDNYYGIITDGSVLY